mgnify:CR=1 FL=1
MASTSKKAQLSLGAKIPLLAEKYRLRFINRTIIDDFPDILEVIFIWGKEMQPGQTFEDYLKNEKKMSNTELKKLFSSSDRNKLKKTNFKGLDVTLISSILPLVCKDIEQNFHTADESKIECQLNKIRKLRNRVMHEPEEGAVDPNVEGEIEDIAMKLLEIAGKMYLKGDDEIQEAKDKAIKIITDAKNMVATKEEQTILCQALLEDIGLLQLREKVKKFKERSSPLLKQVENFYNIKVKVEGTGEIIASEGILKCFEQKNEDVPMKNIIVLQGESGTGKTTLLRAAQEDVLRKAVEKKFEGSQAFEIPLLIACRNAPYSTLSEFWGNEFSEVAERVTGSDLIETALGKMKCLLLVDGIDEINENTKVLTKKVLDFLKNHPDAKCIFTSRPHAVKKFQKELDTEGLLYHILKIENIKTEIEQVDFLSTACKNGLVLATAYKKVNLMLQSPLLLAIYSHFYSRDPNSVESWNLPSHVIRGAIDFGHQTAIQRFHQRNVQACEHIGDIVLEKISFVSFCCLLEKKMSLKRTQIKWLIKKTCKECYHFNVDAIEILSCFFPAISTDSDDVDFLHKSHQETFAAMHLYFKMRDTRKGVQEIIQDACKNYEICGMEDGALQRAYEDEESVSNFFRR